MIPENELDEMDARTDGASEGPWFADYHPEGPCAARCYRNQVISATGVVIVQRPAHAFRGPGRPARESERADAEFIAAARTDMKRLIAEVRRLRSQLGQGDKEET